MSLKPVLHWTCREHPPFDRRGICPKCEQEGATAEHYFGEFGRNETHVFYREYMTRRCRCGFSWTEKPLFYEFDLEVEK